MGNPLFLIKKDQFILWRCKECKNIQDFKEKWDIEISQDFNDMRQEYYLEESKSIRCKKCGSYNVEEVEANSQSS